LPPAERRRTGVIVKLALAVGFEACSRAQLDPAFLPAVFTSSGGDGQNCHEICRTLASNDRQLSPTRFHNSVHNAAAGYWSIGTGATAPSSALCAYDSSFAAGLLEALAQVAVDRSPVLLVAYDTAYPEPLRAKRPIPDAFGIALVLCAEPSLLTPCGLREAGNVSQFPRIDARLTGDAADCMPELPLEALRSTIPAARSLPLLRRFARREPGVARIEYLDRQSLAIEVSLCS
jgi:hypothetical protein